LAARDRQHARFVQVGATGAENRTRPTGRIASHAVYANAQMTTQQIRLYCELSSDAERILERAMQQQGLSARAHDRILKVARTIADLEAERDIRVKHIAEAIQYRTLDRSYWS
jgi:magnesium chelatase family protein